jgi:hypothetical protein
MQNSVASMSSFSTELHFAVRLFVELRAEFDQFANFVGTSANDVFDDIAVAQLSASGNGVFDVLCR